MKKIKYLMPILGLTATVATLAPIATSCNKGKTESTIKYVPVELLDIDAGTLKGLKAGADVKDYNAIEIPASVHTIKADAFPAYVEEEEETNKTAIDLSNIKYAKFHNTLRVMDERCLVGLTGLIECDFTDFTAADFRLLTAKVIDDGYMLKTTPFGGSIDLWNRHCEMKLNSNITGDDLTEVQNILTNIVPTSWLVTKTTGHVKVTDGKQKVELDKGEAQTVNGMLTLTNLVPDGHELYYGIEVVSKGDDVTTNYSGVTKFEISDKNVNLTVHMGMNGQYKDAFDGQNFKFNIIVTDYKEGVDLPIWVEKVEGLELVYTANHVKAINLATTKIEGFVDGGTTKYKLNPELVLDDPTKPASWPELEYIYDENFVKIDEDPLTGDVEVELVGQGSTTITVKSKDLQSKEVTATCEVVSQGTKMAEEASKFESYPVLINPDGEEHTYLFDAPKLDGTCTALYNTGARQFKLVDVASGQTQPLVVKDIVTMLNGVNITDKVTLSGNVLTIPQTITIAKGDHLSFLVKYSPTCKKIQFKLF